MRTPALAALLALSALPACSAIRSLTELTATEGLLATVKKPLTLDPEQLRRACDVEDRGACYLLRGQAPPELHRLPIAQGIAPAGRAVFTAVLAPEEQLSYFLLSRAEKTLRPVPVAKTNTFAPSSFRAERLEVNGLDSTKSYELLVANPRGTLVDIRSFHSLHAEATGFRFAFVGGLDDRASAEADALWKPLFDREPDLLLALGDNAYGTTRAGEPFPITPASLWHRYAETWRALSLFRQPTLVPIAAGWDDRDAGAVPGLPYSLSEDARGVQEAFFAVIANAREVSEGPGIAKAVRLAGHTFVLLDNRSFRTGDINPPACSKNPGECRDITPTAVDEPAHFGRVQDDWAFSQVEHAAGPVWLLAGDPWFAAEYPRSSYAGNHPESFERFRAEMEKALQRAAKAKRAVPLLFGSLGSFAETARVVPFPKSRYASYELTTPGFRASRPATLGWPGARKLDRGAGPAFLFFTTWAKGDGLQLAVEAVGAGNRTLYEEKLSVEPALKVKQPKRRRR